MAILPSLADLPPEVLIIGVSHRRKRDRRISRTVIRMTCANLDEIARLYWALDDSMNIITFHLY
jgi:hypothetical protein